MKSEPVINFNTNVIERSYVEPVVVMFAAPWCGPCKTMKPMVERLSEKLKFALVQIDCDENPSAAQENGVRGVPTLIVYARGDIRLGALVGGKSEAQVRDFLNLRDVTQSELDLT